MSFNKNYKCPCCGYYTFPVPPKNDCGYICPVCFWENDPFISASSEPSDCNHGLTLLDGQKNFCEFGACERPMLVHVRPPKKDELQGID